MIIAVKGATYAAGKKAEKTPSVNGTLRDRATDRHTGFSNWELMGCEFVLWTVRYEICKLQ